ncbi:nucleotidyl transferase AbiEii/AbiGii toxin family protein [Streptomyces sp. NPDC090025]|uniref:nucleotidyl transferase AbiEii/AbiGii toxin family protein n=1 Tax=Streptomyces sp. NPDC090025 TaxID=3365922 RepID=UPI003832F1C3
MNLSNLHRRLLAAVLDIGEPYPLVITDPVTGDDCEVDILKEHFRAAPTPSPYGPVLPFDSVVGTKVRALADRGAVRDFIDVHAASHHRDTTELERLGARHARDEFRLDDLRDRLAGVEWSDDEEFAAYGVSPAETADIRAWAQGWADSLNRRLHDIHDAEG